MNEWMKPRTVFAAAFYLVFLYLILFQLEVPQVLNTMVSTLFGFYYGQKTKKENNL